MTQHYIRATTDKGNSVSIMTGYDRPLGGFFLTVEDISLIEEDEDPVVFDNLGMDDPNPKDFSIFEKVLKDQFGITLPKQMIDAIKEDLLENRGNARTVWDMEGNQISSSRPLSF